MSQTKHIKNYVFRLLARREYSCQELRLKLQLKKFDRAIIDVVLAEMSADNWQNDQRFMQNLITTRINQGYGPLRIQAELRQKGVSEELIKQGMSHYVSAWSELIKHVHSKKFNNQIPLTSDEKAKQLRFLHYRGFDLGQINSLYMELRACSKSYYLGQK